MMYLLIYIPLFLQVTGVVGRAELLSSIFYLWALMVYAKSIGKDRHIGMQCKAYHILQILACQSMTIRVSVFLLNSRLALKWPWILNSVPNESWNCMIKRPWKVWNLATANQMSKLKVHGNCMWLLIGTYNQLLLWSDILIDCESWVLNWPWIFS